MVDNTQGDFPLPTPGNNKRTAAEFLPRFFRTEANKKFLQATLDQLIQPGVAEKLNGYYGRRTAKAFKPTDNYIPDVSADREARQLEPSLVIKDDLDNVTFYKDYNDFINQIKYFGIDIFDHNRLNTQESYVWNPHIDWDKFVNFREYFWLPNGPSTVPVRGQSREVISTYTVTTEDQGDNVSYVFNDGLVRNPTLKLYRGQTYRFEINTPGYPIAFAVTRSFTPGNAILVAGREGVRGPGLYDATLYGNEYDIGDYIVLPSSGSVSFEDDENVSTLFEDGVRRLGDEGEEIANVYIENGVIEFTIPLNAPNKLYYISKNDIDTSGLINIYDIEENTLLDVGNDILGKKTYTSANGVEFSNGMKVEFQGTVIPNSFETGKYYVEGVGTAIKLIPEENLIIAEGYSAADLVDFDTTGFDTLPFDNASFFPREKDYLTINRASQDGNAWTRSNRWFHRSVIEKSLEYNQLPVSVNESRRAKRPIIEFEAGLKLFNYGTKTKKDVDLIDTVTKDVFSNIEGSLGYNVDGVQLAEGMRVLFAADTDILVNGKIYEVRFITIGNDRQISLVETEDAAPLENETVLVTQGVKNGGKIYFYNGIEWKSAQQKTGENQAPMFDLCCPQGNFYSDLTTFDSSTFKGTKIFSYKVGEGTVDAELGFPLTYRNIENSGDIVFEFNLLTDIFTVQSDDGVFDISTSTANLRNYSSRTDFKYVNGWTSKPVQTKQRVLRQYSATQLQTNNFEIDVYDRAGDLNDLKVIVYVNNKLKKRLQDFEIDRINGTALVRFYNDLEINDVVLIKTESSTPKNSNGWYDFPLNLERNPLNEDIKEFTLGEVIDHVDTMIEELQEFNGSYPGISNLRDLGNVDRYGKRFLKHSGPLNLAIYHITNKKYNLVKAIEFNRKEYAKFKRNFVNIASSLGYDGILKNHVDLILKEVNKDKVKTDPFYFSDMLAYSGEKRIEYEIFDPANPFYALSEVFNLDQVSSKMISVYLNGKQLIHNRHYTFSEEGFLVLNANQKENDILEVFEYESTDGSYVPPTPTKLGLYPKYEPHLTIDDTYITTNDLVFDNVDYTTSGVGEFAAFSVKITSGISSYIVEVLTDGSNFRENEKITIKGSSLNGINGGNDCVITVESVYKNGSIRSIRVDGVPADIDERGPYKIYGEIDDEDSPNSRGWFYPVYTDRKLASTQDINNQTVTLKFKGLNKIFYAPVSDLKQAAQDSIEYNDYPYGVPMIRGHDGSYVRAWKDYRDELLLDFEKRIFNNIKIDYNQQQLQITDYVGGKFRKTDFNKKEIDNSLLKDFVEWLSLVDADYTSNNNYNRNNHYTFNYSSMTSTVDGTLLPGYWRAVYKEAFDTDRPHTHPWEMLGFSIKPSWWDSVYGPAPYTSNNLILWEDLENGIIREPNKQPKAVEKYSRPGLLSFIPSDSQGQLKSPIDSGYAKNFFFRNTSLGFKFGDEAPVETAWRRSSEYPYAILKSWMLNQPAKVIGLGFDVSRTNRNLSGQNVYRETGKQIKIKDLNLPNTYQDNERIITSGLVNFLYNLVSGNILSVYEDYKDDLQRITNQLGIKIGGFTDKNKFKLVLDSKSPSNTNSNIFVPDENYQIFLNTSSPIGKSVVYSAITVEKQPDGFIVRGYNYDTPYFRYYEPIITSSDIAVTVGGISEVTARWEPNTEYFKGQVVEHDFKYYRVTEDFTSSATFTTEFLASLPELPIVGGKRAIFRRNFEKRQTVDIDYGSKLRTSQEVVDLILGYGEWLKDQGFTFEYFNIDTGNVENWDQMAREFLFWTTQGWSAGSTISLSPSASKLDFKSEYSVVDDIYDLFYDYSLLKEDGLPLERKFSSILRDENNFGIEPKKTNNGIYNVKLPLVQKEHVVLIDNETVFNDIIYQPTSGYRAERIRVLGYRSDDWKGGLNIPGFIYDDAKVTDWEQWKDYQIGSLIRYKQFYYVAIINVTGSETFNPNFWYRLNEKPEPEMISNFEYKVNQFADFYDLDTDNFDAEQQRLAQHLIGYQKRDYLANIINDDISQYKFYQGFIQDKGTKNALDKIFKSLRSDSSSGIEFYEEWAIQTGRYGTTDNVQQVEYVIDESKIQTTPQAFELVDSLTLNNFDKTYEILPYEAYDAPFGYNHKPFPTKKLVEILPTGGYVHEDDVEYKAGGLDELESGDVNLINQGEYFWTVYRNPLSWNVYQASEIKAKAIQLEDRFETRTDGQKNLFNLYLDRWVDGIFKEGDLIGVKGADIRGFYKINKTGNNFLIIEIPLDQNVSDFEEESFSVIKLNPCRFEDSESLQDYANTNLLDDQKIWVDDYENGKWKVLEKSNVFDLNQTILNTNNDDENYYGFATSISTSKSNNDLIIGSPYINNGEVYYYKRSQEKNNLLFNTTITPPLQLFDSTNSNFGESISLSEDGKYLAIGIPNASFVKTRYKGEFNAAEDYNEGDIVKYRETLWKTNRDIFAGSNSVTFSTHNSYYNIKLNETRSFNLLLTGAPGLENKITDHFLVKPTISMYIVTSPGDEVTLKWNTKTFNHLLVQDSDERQPWNDTLDIKAEDLSNTFIISSKIDEVLLLKNVRTTLNPGDDLVTGRTNSKVERFIYTEGDRNAVAYIQDVKGILDFEGEIFKLDPITGEEIFVAEYEIVNYDSAESLSGYWIFDINPYSNGTEFIDSGSGLVYVDIQVEAHENLETHYYYNIYDQLNLESNFSYISVLSYYGHPTGISDVEQFSDLWVIRTTPEHSNFLTQNPNSTLNIELYDYASKTLDLQNNSLGNINFTEEKTVYDLWDGYIDFEYNRFDNEGQTYDILPGDRIGIIFRKPSATDTSLILDIDPSQLVESVVQEKAEVVFVQRNFNNSRIYLKNVQGDWSLRNNTYRIDVLKFEDINPTTTLTRIAGVIQTTDYNNQVNIENEFLGKLIVFQESQDLPLSRELDLEIVDWEYSLFKKENIQETSTLQTSIPNSLNKDYTQVYNITADLTGSSTRSQEGAVAVYKKISNSSEFSLENILVSEYATENRQFGKKVKIVKNQDRYILLVSSVENLDNNDSKGKIEFFLHGVTETDYYRGDWTNEIVYNRDDIVLYKDDFYKALTTIPIGTNINNNLYWTNISWRSAKDTNYRGRWLDSTNPLISQPDGFARGSIVFYNDSLWISKTNTIPGPFKESSWEKVTDSVNYVGYIPNLTDNNFFNDLEINFANDIVNFAEDFDVSDNGNTLVVKTRLLTDNKVKLLVYKLQNSRYKLTQIIDNIQGSDIFAYKISINSNGDKFAISDPFNDDNLIDQGIVRIYVETVFGNFELSQTIYSPSNEANENFGFDIDFTDNNLVISSKNGDNSYPTTFDDNDTIFDSNFTKFSNIKYDTGSVYIYEEISNKFVFAESVKYNAANYSFGERIHFNSNHLYIGLPRVKSNNKEGILLDYRKPKGSRSWKIIREQIDAVDINKIQSAFLYNKRTNEIVTYLDFIDPIQGKIAGIADEAISFKVPYDPAFYNAGTITERINRDVFWADEHKNKIWWNTSNARFTYPYVGNIEYQKENWNELQPGAIIDVCEWVESDLLPSQWDTLADTEDGLVQGISGTSLYGDNLYSKKFVYDKTSARFTEKYYYWVRYKRTKTENRQLSALDIARLIAEPRKQGYRFISFLSNNRFVLNNCNNYFYNKDIVLNIRYLKEDKKENNVHSVYQILSDGDVNSNLDERIERKWFDSLIGSDIQRRKVPDINLTPKQRYGVQDRPRQGMFVNRIEALKQTLESVNSILKKNIIIDIFDISPLLDSDKRPSIVTGKFDVSIDSLDELRFISTDKLEQAQIEPVVVNGRLDRVRIVNPGRGYRVPPSCDIDGAGKNAEIKISINNLGQITDVDILNRGTGYTDNTRITVRKFSVLINADETINGRWSIQEWDKSRSEWYRKAIQSYDVTRYWNYVDWYQTGYNEFTAVDYTIDGTYKLPLLNDRIGDIVKVENIGSGGWLMLEKYNDAETDDYTESYRVIGRQNGTIQFSDTLYDYSKNAVGFDNRSFDSFYYDTDPATELRIILNTIKNNIFVNDLKVEYNKLFISSLRYILNEQLYVDWLFKTSFIKIKYSDGELDQEINYRNNKIESYRSYIEEVKPYKTVIRELVTSYNKTENTNSAVTDFDLPPAYDERYKEIRPSSAIIANGIVSGLNSNTAEYPRRWWTDNYGYGIKEILVGKPGSRYTVKPVIRIEGNGEGARAEAYLGVNGSIGSIRVIDPGKGYTEAPKVIIEGSQLEDGVTATATAVLGNGLVRSPTIRIKFDRTSGQYYILTLEETETFTGTNINIDFDLKWPMDLRNNTVSVIVNNREMLRSEYSYTNIENQDTGYTRYQGQIQFTKPPALGAEIVVNYKKDISMLSAEDRILHAYNPVDGQLSNELNQLLDGVDYGGVEINGFEFGQPKGWDTDNWFGGKWDEFDETYEDYVFEFDGSTIAVDLESPLEKGVVYNVYLNGVRIDDPNYGTPNQTNTAAQIGSILGDGVTQIIDLDEAGIKVQADDVLIVRKTTSDGSFMPNPDAYDMMLSGGDLTYKSATGLRAEDIIVDGDGFVTPTTSKGTEELVPGQVMDTLDIQVYATGPDSTEVAFRQFKDMLNRTHFKRIDTVATELSQDLNYYDLRIEVIDGSKLPEPDKMRNRPGIIWINSERIEYLIKEGNTLRQLRRGTLGTGIKTVHTTGSKIYDQSSSKNIPYKDQTQIQTVTIDSLTREIELDFIANSINEFEVFLNGIRLRKEAKSMFDPTLAMDSPDGDIVLDPEFEFDASTNKITINTQLTDVNNINIVRKVGKLWELTGESITTTNTEIGSFLRQRT